MVNLFLQSTLHVFSSPSFVLPYSFSTFCPSLFLRSSFAFGNKLANGLAARWPKLPFIASIPSAISAPIKKLLQLAVFRFLALGIRHFSHAEHALEGGGGGWEEKCSHEEVPRVNFRLHLSFFLLFIINKYC